jgi:hypothetical protein
MEHETTGLIQDLFFSFVGPWAFYLVASSWAKICGAFTGKNKRTMLTTTLLFILFGLTLTGFAEWATLGTLVSKEPISTSIGFLATGAAVSGVLWLIVSIWRPRTS